MKFEWDKNSKKFSKMLVYMPPEVVLFSEIVENACLFLTGNFPKSNQKIRLNGKSSLFSVRRKKIASPIICLISICPKPLCEAYKFTPR